MTAASVPFDVEQDIASHLEAIQRHFKNSKVTLLARSLDVSDGSRDLVMTDDDLREAIQALEIRANEAAPSAQH